MGAGASLTGAYNVAHKELMKKLREETQKPLDCNDLKDFEEAKTELGRIRTMLGEALQKLTSEHQVVKRYEKKEVTLEDGTIITCREDGSKLVQRPDGTSVETLTDETVIQKNSNGTKITQRPDGSVFQENKDGSSIEKLSDGTMIQISAKGTKLEVSPDGSKKQTMPDGSTLRRYADGTSIEEDTAGHKIVMYSDGRKIQHNPNGTVIETNPDGYKIQTMIDGAKIEFLPNGTRIDTHSSGDVIETHSDGTVLKRKVVSAVCVSCSRCQTTINAGAGGFIVCCPICHYIQLAVAIDDDDEDMETKKDNIDTSNHRHTELVKMFKNYDTNNDGFIDASELGKVLEALNFAPTSYGDLLIEHGGETAKLNQEQWNVYLPALQSKIIEVYLYILVVCPFVVHLSSYIWDDVMLSH
jgi:hypothetical protein